MIIFQLLLRKQIVNIIIITKMSVLKWDTLLKVKKMVIDMKLLMNKDMNLAFIKILATILV